MVGALYLGEMYPSGITLEPVRSGSVDLTGTGVISVSTMILWVSGLIAVSGDANIKLRVDPGAVGVRGQIDATYLRNFPRHRNNFSARKR